MSTRIHRYSSALLAIALTTAPLAAQAQAPAPPGAEGGSDAVTQARQHFMRGVKLYEEDDFRSALIEFNRAYELAPNWGVLYNIGQSYYQLRDYANGLRTLERYAREGGAQIAPERRAQIDKEMAELRGRVAHVTLTSNVEGAEITLDDASIGRTPLAEPALIGTGRHKLSISRPGYVPVTKTVDIAGGDRLTIPLDLAEVPREGEPGAAAQTAAVVEAPSHAPAFVVGGIGVAGVVVGAIFGGLAIGNKSSLNGECDAAKHCTASSQPDIDAFSRNTTISTVGFSVGLVGLAAGTIIFLTERPKTEPTPVPAALRVTPWVGPGSAGVSGTF
ncbi:MAG TPA: PEGA domain-containing protein [Polyangiaceae bacterium]